ncbi:hypothetical protein B0H14DRAFT_2625016 [Mycena olivaceomarginata]|nr:hypothetical protein B0H14DRAFT_2625016 [Mycena olivaceomarginata]
MYYKEREVKFCGRSRQLQYKYTRLSELAEYMDDPVPRHKDVPGTRVALQIEVKFCGRSSKLQYKYWKKIVRGLQYAEEGKTESESSLLEMRARLPTVPGTRVALQIEVKFCGRSSKLQYKYRKKSSEGCSTLRKAKQNPSRVCWRCERDCQRLRRHYCQGRNAAGAAGRQEEQDGDAHDLRGATGEKGTSGDGDNAHE